MGEASRPLLLPQNRKLRHLQGIYVRNLTLSRPRGRTIDDGELNKTPQKLEALRASGTLHHAHSSGDLRPPKLRRRSSNWVGATPDFRQKKLEDVIDSRMADTFFTLHCAGQEDPIYISEVVEKAMNPTFRFFDLSSFGPATTRLHTVPSCGWHLYYRHSFEASETQSRPVLTYLLIQRTHAPLEPRRIHTRCTSYTGRIDFPDQCHITYGT